MFKGFDYKMYPHFNEDKSDLKFVTLISNKYISKEDENSGYREYTYSIQKMKTAPVAWQAIQYIHDKKDPIKKFYTLLSGIQ